MSNFGFQAKHVVIDGITFDSKSEGRTYHQIKHVLGKDIIYPHHVIEIKANQNKSNRLTWAADFVIIPDINSMQISLIIEYKENPTKKFITQLRSLAFYRPELFSKLWIVSESIRGTVEGIKPIHPVNLITALEQFKKDSIDVT